MVFSVNSLSPTSIGPFVGQGVWVYERGGGALDVICRTPGVRDVMMQGTFDDWFLPYSGYPCSMKRAGV